MLFKFTEKSFGLDIGEKSLRVVNLKKIGGRIKLAAYGETTLAPGLIKDGLIVEKDKLAEEIRKLIKNPKGGKIYTRYAIVCLPEPKTFIKVIRVPFRKGKEVINDIIEETEKHIPYPLEKSYFDWQYIDLKDKTKVLIGVAPKEIVENYQEVLSKAGVKPMALEIEAAAIARSLFPLNQRINEPVMVIDFGGTRTGVLIYEKDYIPFSISLNSSSDDLTKFIEKKLNLSHEEAEAAKCQIGFDEKKAGGNLRRILAEPLNELCKQVREAKYFYGEHFDSKDLKAIYVTGGGSYLPGLLKCVAEHSGLKVEPGNPLANISQGSLTIPDSKLQTFTTALGLALRQYE